MTSAHAHNFFLQTALDFGAPGLIALVAMYPGGSRCSWCACGGGEPTAALRALRRRGGTNLGDGPGGQLAGADDL